jgi:hypothetical protein
LALVYQMDTFPDTGSDLADFVNTAALRIAYTGTTDFLISLDLSYDWFKNKEGGESTKLTTTLISLRYYF